jgi:hypothetical protein
METQTQEPIQETPTPKKSKLPYVIGTGLVVLLAVATFVAGRYLNRGNGNFSEDPMGGSGPILSIGNGQSGGEAKSFKLDIEPAEELPKTQPETRGLFVERKDNSIFISTGRVTVMAKVGEGGGDPVVDTDYDGDKVEVVVSNDTIIYRDTTELDPENPEETVQQTVELGTIDDVTPQSSITVWGRKAGDRIIADIIVFSSPFMMKAPPKK